MEKVRSILLKVQIKGRGVVNYDSSDQKHLWNKYTDGTGQEKCVFDNVTFAKKNIYENKDKPADKKLIISSNCLRHYLFGDDAKFQSPNVVNNEAVLYTMIANPGILVRGYTVAEKDADPIKRSSSLCITDAEQTNDVVSAIETYSKSGQKTSDENKSDTTFFKKEKVGNIEYEAVGGIDLMQLQFVSSDLLFDRMGFNADNFDLYSKILSSRLPNFNSKLGYYQIKNSSIEIPEYGFLFSDENVIEMVKDTLKKILKLSIYKAGAFAEVVDVKYKFLIDPFKDKLTNDNDWNDLTIDVINSLDFTPEDFYVEMDTTKSTGLRSELEDIVKEKKAKSKAASDDKKQKIKEYKESIAKKENN